jgi:ATP-binding cassette subfamily C protein CydC
VLAILAAAASAVLMGLAGWLVVRSAQTGLSATSTFSWIYPAAGVEALTVVRTAARYGERLITHGATLQVLARLRAGGDLARARAAARARLVEVLDGRMEIATYGAGPRALAELGQRFRATDASRRRWSAREGVGQLGNDLAAAGAVAVAVAVAAVLTNGAGLGARQAPADPAVPQPTAPESGAWARGDITLCGLIAGMGDEPALWISELDLPGGAFTVLTGASGAGKSTLLRVLAGALQPLAGSVRIGGTDPHGLGYDDLVADVTFMEQDSQLLSGTVADNLRLARPDATADELRAAMKVALLAGHVDLESQIGPGGEVLSGGQQRRLGVAQAYLRHPGLLLLDEPTEGLDHHTARALLENLRSALPGTTIIAAIHDRTLDHLPVPADAIIRLAAGRVLRVT